MVTKLWLFLLNFKSTNVQHVFSLSGFNPSQHWRGLLHSSNYWRNKWGAPTGRTVGGYAKNRRRSLRAQTRSQGWKQQKAKFNWRKRLSSAASVQICCANCNNDEVELELLPNSENSYNQSPLNDHSPLHYTLSYFGGKKNIGLDGVSQNYTWLRLEERYHLHPLWHRHGMATPDRQETNTVIKKIIVKKKIQKS